MYTYEHKHTHVCKAQYSVYPSVGIFLLFTQTSFFMHIM